jgi:hypothetical protein
VAALSRLIDYAQETRRETVLLRAEASRLTEEAARTRRTHVVRRESCHEALVQTKVTRERLPSWPAWGLPTQDLHFTLVPLE